MKLTADISFQILTSLGYNVVKRGLLGEGAFAYCFKIENTKRVIKITSNLTDFLIAVKLMKRRMRNFTKVYKTEKIMVNNTIFYLIEAHYERNIVRQRFGWGDNISEICSDISYIFYACYNYPTKPPYFHEVENDLIEKGWCFHDPNFKKYVKVLTHEYRKIFIQARKLGVVFFDYHPSNVSLNGDKLVVVDFGFGGYEEEETDELNQIKITTEIKL